MGENIKDLIYSMIDISEKKLEYLRIIYRLTGKQERFIRLERVDDLLKQIELKDDYIRKINELDSAYYKNYEKIKSNLNVNSIEKINVNQYPYIEKLNELLKEVKNLLNEIKEAEDRNIKNLEISKNEMRNKIKGLKQEKKVNNAYAGYTKQVTSVFMDQSK